MLTLEQLNSDKEGELYKEFPGIISYHMPELLAEGRAGMSIYDIVLRRANVLTKKDYSDEVIDAWLNNYFDTVDAIGYYPKEKGAPARVKLVRNSALLQRVGTDIKLSGGELKLSGREYENLEGMDSLEMSADEARKWLSYGIEKSRVDENKIWLFYTQNHLYLLVNYVRYVAEKGGFTHMMGIEDFLSVHDEPVLMQLRIKSLEERSSLMASSELRHDSCRLVGMLKEH